MLSLVSILGKWLMVRLVELDFSRLCGLCVVRGSMCRFIFGVLFFRMLISLGMSLVVVVLVMVSMKVLCVVVGLKVFGVSILCSCCRVLCIVGYRVVVSGVGFML